MPTQTQIAEHLDLDQSAVSRMLDKLSINWQKATMDEIRVEYIRHLRGQASGHRSSGGLDLVHERVLTERVDRELKQLQVAEKRGLLINVEQLEPEYMNMVSAFRAELLSRDDKLVTELKTLYGIDIDVGLLNDHTHAALSQLSQYDPSANSFSAQAGISVDATSADDNNRVVEALSGDIGKSVSDTR